MNLVLSLFPGIGLLDMAFEEEGFCVVRGPDLLWGGDIRRFHPPAGKFDGVIGGPPCQAFSSLAALVRHNGYAIKPNLIPEFNRVVQEAQPRWWLMENVRRAPDPQVPGYAVQRLLLNNRSVGGIQNRVRKFNFGSVSGLRLQISIIALEPIDSEPCVTAYERSGGISRKECRKPISCRLKKGRSIEQMCVAQGLPADFLVSAPFTAIGKSIVIGNGIPLPMGRAVAKAVKRALEEHRRIAGAAQ